MIDEIAMSASDAYSPGAIDDKRAGPARLVSRPFVSAFVVVSSLFFLWAIANGFNDILIKQFQKALDLTRVQSGLVQSAFYFGYFTFALPAGWVLTRVGYKGGIVIGLGLYALGAALFFPAANSRAFGLFLFALYVIAAGLAFLETAANPLITKMGPARTAAQRLNLAQGFNGFGTFLAPFIGGALILSGIEYSAVDLATLPPAQLDAWRASEARAVQMPYLALAGFVLIMALTVLMVRLPAIEDQACATPEIADTRAIWSIAPLRWAVIAQFFYVGAQVSLWSYFINFAQDIVGAGEKVAAQYLGISLMTFMLGRFAGTALMRFVLPARLLMIYGLVAAALCAVAIAANSWLALVALGLTSFFMSIMFPTIFALGIADLSTKTKLGSSLLIMAIIGGALFPPLTGLIADAAGSIQAGMIVPLVCFLVVAQFGRFSLRGPPVAQSKALPKRKQDGGDRPH